VDRDLGFAPNPFHGYCSLATCKPGIRKSASINDWVIGMGGGRLKATGCCVYAMRVDEKISFNEYWNNPIYNDKKPVRNGTKRMLVGDNIYHQNENGEWLQANSHHSHEDGSINMHNVVNDTQSNNVLISRHFYYFGQSAPQVPDNILDAIGYKNQRNYRVFASAECEPFLQWLRCHYQQSLNQVLAKPFDFDKSHVRYSVHTNLMTK
jgi:hypothetical protein